MSLRANRLGIRSIRSAMESLGVNKHDDVNDDTPREFDPNAGKTPEEIETVKKEGEIENATPPKKSDIISQEDLEAGEQLAPEVAEAAKQGTEETGELVDGVADTGAAAVVAEAEGPEAVEVHTDAVTGEAPVADLVVPAEGSEDPVVSAAIAEGEVTTDGAEAADTGEVAVTPDPADPAATNDNEGQEVLAGTEAEAAPIEGADATPETSPADAVLDEEPVVDQEEQTLVPEQIEAVIDAPEDENVTPEGLENDDVVLEQSIESLSSSLRMLTKISRKSGSMESYAAEAISDDIVEKFKKFWEWIKTQMRRMSAYLKSLFDRAISRLNAGAEKATVAALKSSATSKINPEAAQKVREGQQFKNAVAALNKQQADNPAFDFVTRGDVGPINELIKAFEAVAKHRQLIESINKLMASGDPKQFIEQDFFGKNASEVAALNAATREIFENQNNTASTSGAISEDGFLQALTRYPRIRVSGDKATVISRLATAANSVRSMIPQAVSDRGMNTFMQGVNEDVQAMADTLQNTQMGVRNYYKIIGGISLMLKSVARCSVTILGVDSMALALYGQANGGKLNFGGAKPAAATTEDIEGQTAVGEGGVTEGEDTGGDPAVPAQDQPADGGDPAGEVAPREAETVTEDTAGVIADPTTEMDEPIEEYNQTLESIEEAVNDLGFVEREIDRVKDSLEEGGLSANEAGRLEDSMEGIARRHKLSFAVKMPSMESFQAGPATRLRNTQYTLEGLEEFYEKLKEVIIKAAQYVSKLFEAGYMKGLELATNLRKDFVLLKKELAKAEFKQGAQTTLESAALAKRLVIGSTVPSSYVQTLRTVSQLGTQLGNGSTDIRSGEFVKKIGRAMESGAHRPTELAESLLGVSKVSDLKPSTNSDGNVEYSSPVLFGNKQVKVVIPDSDWNEVDVNKLSAGVVEADGGGTPEGNTVQLPGKADALAIANYGATLDASMQAMRVRATELKQIASAARTFSAQLGKTGYKGSEDDGKQVSISGAKVISFTNRLVGLAGQPMLDYNRYLLLLGRDLAALLRATIKAQNVGEAKVDAAETAQAA